MQKKAGPFNFFIYFRKGRCKISKEAAARRVKARQIKSTESYSGSLKFNGPSGMQFYVAAVRLVKSLSFLGQRNCY